MSCEFYDNISSEDVQSSLLTTLSRLEDGKPEGRIAAGSWTRGKIDKTKNGVWKTRNGNVFNDERISLDISMLPIRVFTDAIIVRT